MTSYIPLKKVDSIKKFGSFKDFKWNKDIPELNRYNLIYGWNGSGKTTLSRLFRCFETGEVNNSFKGAEFNIGSLNNKNLSKIKGRIRVFNLDFVKENIKWEDKSTNSLIRVGKDAIDLSGLENAQKDTQGKLETAEKLEKTKNKEFESFYTQKAKSIKENLIQLDPQNYTNYSSRRLKNDFVNIAPFKRLEIDELKACSDLLKMDKEKDEVDEMPPLEFNHKELLRKATTLCQENVSKSAISFLSDDIRNWVKLGFEIHDEMNLSKCAFCGNDIDNKRLEELSTCFRDSYNKLKENLTESIKDLKEAIAYCNDYNRKEISKSFDLYPDFQNDFNSKKDDCRKLLNKIVKNIELILGYLNSKFEDPFNNNILDEKFASISQCINDDIVLVESYLTELNNTIIAHCDFSKSFSDKKLDSGRKILSHEIAEITGEQKEKHKALNEAEKAAQDLKTEFDLISEEIEKKSLKYENVVDAAIEINKHLIEYMGHSHIRLEPNQDDKNSYKLMHGEREADNLSEGERTGIAFAYFIASLNQKGFSLEESIIVIDDPISSLDSNNLYYIASMIRKYIKPAKQVFILTHNYTFFRELHKWFNKIDNNYQNKLKDKGENGYKNATLCNRLMVKRTSNDNDIKSTIENIDPLFEKYESEYHFLFSELHKFINNGDKELESIYPYANMARKVLEIFFGFKSPQDNEYQNVINNFNDSIKDEKKLSSVAVDRMVRLIERESHSQYQEGQSDFSDGILRELPQVIKDTFNLIEQVDKGHYKGMLKAIK